LESMHTLDFTGSHGVAGVAAVGCVRTLDLTGYHFVADVSALGSVLMLDLNSSSFFDSITSCTFVCHCACPFKMHITHVNDTDVPYYSYVSRVIVDVF
jgi:hypothetical protein